MSDALADILRNCRVLLLDFDGPVCDFFAGYPARDIARRLLTIVEGADAQLAKELDRETNPHVVLRAVASGADLELSRTVAGALSRDEQEAAVSATPTPGFDAVLLAAERTNRRAAIVSNNDSAAISKYLDRSVLSDRLHPVVGRDVDMDPGLLKPDPHLLMRALAALDVPPGQAVFVGDSVSDIEAGRLAGISTIGYANKRGKHDRLIAAGAFTVMPDMDQLAEALAEVPAWPQPAKRPLV